MDVLKAIFTGIQIISALGLIFLVMSQTTKSEGLSGTIGGKVSSSFRGKPGKDEQLALLTRYCAILFMGMSILVYIMSAKPGGV